MLQKRNKSEVLLREQSTNKHDLIAILNSIRTFRGHPLSFFLVEHIPEAFFI